VFGIGTWEFMLILILALIVLGPSKLPGIAKSLGRGYAEFKRASQELRDSLTSEVGMSDFRESINDARRSLEADISIEDIHQQKEGSSFPLEEIKLSDFDQNDGKEIESVTHETPQKLDDSREKSFADNSTSTEGNHNPGIGPEVEKESEDLDKTDASEQGIKEDNLNNG